VYRRNLFINPHLSQQTIGHQAALLRIFKNLLRQLLFHYTEQMIDTIKRKFVLSQLPYLVIRVAIGAIYIYAGVGKLVDINAFARTIDQYDIVPDALLSVVAFGLPALEVIAGLGLIFDISGSLIAVLAMLMMFVVVLGYGILNNLDVDCGCFSPEEILNRGNLKQALFRDLVMIAAVFFLFISRRVRSLSAQHPSLWGKFRLFKGGS
jgi:uncharacterized membrane protein YphA (DoxX/SURF4 family)